MRAGKQYFKAIFPASFCNLPDAFLHSLCIPTISLSTPYLLPTISLSTPYLLRLYKHGDVRELVRGG